MVDDIYSWFKVIHVIAFIAWMAGLLYLPRLFVYHSSVADDSAESKLFLVMERRLMRAIMHPAMIVTLITGGLLLSESQRIDWESDIWIYLKLICVLALVVAHFFMLRCYYAFVRRKNAYKTRFFRIFNEVPTILMIAIVILVVVKPF